MNIGSSLLKFIALGACIAVAVVALTLWGSNTWVARSASGKTFTDTETIPHNHVGLVLGTSKYVGAGRINAYFHYRVTAAAALFHSGKVDALLVSGDNGSAHYDEPTAFKQALMERGVPEQHIYLDYAGFRTLDSIVRAKKVFGQDNITVISQRFHNERAIFLAQHFGINAIGFNAKDVTGRSAAKTDRREYLARTKAVIDIILNVQPKFLGPPITIP